MTTISVHCSHPTSPAASCETVCAGAHTNGRRVQPAAAAGQEGLGLGAGAQAGAGAGKGVGTRMGRSKASVRVTRSALRFQIALMLGLLVAMLHSVTGAGGEYRVRREFTLRRSRSWSWDGE